MEEASAQPRSNPHWLHIDLDISEGSSHFVQLQEYQGSRPYRTATERKQADVRKDTLAILDRLGFPEEHALEAKLVIDELTTNLWKHSSILSEEYGAGLYVPTLTVEKLEDGYRLEGQNLAWGWNFHPENHKDISLAAKQHDIKGGKKGKFQTSRSGIKTMSAVSHLEFIIRNGFIDVPGFTDTQLNMVFPQFPTEHDDFYWWVSKLPYGHHQVQHVTTTTTLPREEIRREPGLEYGVRHFYPDGPQVIYTPEDMVKRSLKQED